MILVDSSVWIDILRSPHSEQLSRIDKIIEDEAATCGVIVQEVLQGFKRQADFEWAKTRFLLMPWFEITQEMYLKAAKLTRDLRQEGKGITTVDALIASVAMHSGIELWTLDQDFNPMVSKGLRLYQQR